MRSEEAGLASASGRSQLSQDSWLQAATETAKRASRASASAFNMADKPCVVVLAADASEHSEYALQFYLDNIHQDCNDVHVVTCPDCRFQSADYELSASRLEAELQESKAQAGALEKKCLDRMLSHGVYAKFSVLQNTKPAHAILAFAKDVRADLIVTGTRGLGKVRRTIMGSVSDHILHNADVPVLICRRK